MAARKVSIARLMALLLVLPLLLLGQAALAEVGRVLFVAGEVTVERAGLVPRDLAEGDGLLAGDTVVTGTRSRAQLLMADGARLALRADTRLQLDTLDLPDSVVAPGQARAVAGDGSSVSTLIRGGFRTQTGSVGRQDPDAYEVRTPVGVLGIRGTEYAAVLCVEGSCADLAGDAPADGLYLGVYRNAIVLRRPGQPPLEIEAGRFVYVPLVGIDFEWLPAPPPHLEEDAYGPLETGVAPAATRPQELPGFGTRRSPAAQDAGEPPPPAEDSPQLPVGGSRDGEPVDLTPGTLPQAGVAPPPDDQFRDIAFSIGQAGPEVLYATAAVNAPGDFTIDGGLDLERFRADWPVFSFTEFASIELETATVAESDADATTLLRWGRWSGGTVEVTDSDGNLLQLVDLADASLHWISSAGQDQPVQLPVSGSASYLVTGSTSPTNNFGVTGVLGSVTLDADFTNLAVNSTLSLTLDDRQWEAIGGGTIGTQQAAHHFSGFYDLVVITDPVTGTEVGNGNFAGFFSEPGGSDGLPGGAGLTFSLGDSGLIERVEGSVAFELDPP